MSEENYVGDELEIFAKAENWKNYFSNFISPFLGENTLEVGAGIGATTEIFYNKNASFPKNWLCLEPDAELLVELESKIKKEELPAFCSTKNGLIADLEKDALFDTIIYIDVLEHIEKDHEELLQACQHLRKGGKIIVLSPAYQSLYSPFDKAIGHFRRYDKKSLTAIAPPDAKILKLIYLDSVGVFLSFANRLLLRQNNPTAEQIQFWDKVIIPISKIIDPLIGYSTGRSILCVLEKTK